MAIQTIDESASGSTVRLAVGDSARLTLPETRSGGYKWQAVSPDSPVVQVEDDGFEMAAAIGGTGVHRWTITGKQAGEAEFVLVYGRSWETEQGKRFQVTIVVS